MLPIKQIQKEGTLHILLQSQPPITKVILLQNQTTAIEAITLEVIDQTGEADHQEV